jgi:general secretion pathway protein E
MAKADTQQTLENQFAQRLKQHGYEVTRDAKIKGNSGAEHVFAMMAHKDDGLVNYDVVIGSSVSQRDEVGLGAVFNFDEKANDAGLPDRVFLAIPKLGSMAANFAQQEHIKVFDEKALAAFLDSPPPAAKHLKPLEFNTKAQLLKSLAERGYKTEGSSKIKGISGVEHAFDTLAYLDDGLVTHPVSIDFLSADTEVEIEPVSNINARAQDTGIIRSVIVASPKLSDDARQFAEKQQIKVFEVGKAIQEKPAQKAAQEKPATEPPVSKKITPQTSKETGTVKVPESVPARPSVITGTASSVSKTNVSIQTSSPEALNILPEKLARKYNAVPLAVNDNTLRVAMANPDDILAIQALAARTKMRIEPVPATLADIQEAIDFNYRPPGEVGKQQFGEIGKFGEIDKQFNLAALSSDRIQIDKAAAEIADGSPIAKALNLLVEEAVKARSSDIHIEPEEDRLRVRYRIDGILHEVTTLPIGAHGPLISRIKILAGMNIADPRRPQDGQFSLVATGRDIDVRVATISTVHGETAVLRLLDKSVASLSRNSSNACLWHLTACCCSAVLLALARQQRFMLR